MPPLGKGTLGTWRFHQCSAVPDTEPEHHRGLVQFCTLSTVCKRCQKPLGIRYATLILSHNRRDEENCPEELALALGHLMRTMRLDRHMTQAECATRLCTSRSQLSRIETGHLRPWPSFSILFRAARLFDFDRSEERRVGKECRSRWSPSHWKKK